MFESTSQFNRDVDLTRVVGLGRFYKNKPLFSLKRLIFNATTGWLLVVAILLTTIVMLSQYALNIRKQYASMREQLFHSQIAAKSHLDQKRRQIDRLLALQETGVVRTVITASSMTKILSTAYGDKREFIEQIIPEAIKTGVAYEIPPSAIIGMAIYESAYGTSSLAREHHNYFGMKAFKNSWSGPVAENVSTVDSGVRTQADFRSYPSMKDGVRGFAEFVSGSTRYTKAFKQQDGVNFVKILNKSGYCPDRDYTSNVSKIIERHKLELLDGLALEYLKPVPGEPQVEMTSLSAKDRPSVPTL